MKKLQEGEGTSKFQEIYNAAEGYFAAQYNLEEEGISNNQNNKEFLQCIQSLKKASKALEKLQ